MTRRYTIKLERSRPRNPTVVALIQITGGGRHQKSSKALRAQSKRDLKNLRWD